MHFWEKVPPVELWIYVFEIKLSIPHLAGDMGLRGQREGHRAASLAFYLIAKPSEMGLLLRQSILDSIHLKCSLRLEMAHTFSSV